MARTFDGISDQIVTASGGVSGFAYGTFAFILRAGSMGTSGNEVCRLHNSGGGGLVGLTLGQAGNTIVWSPNTSGVQDQGSGLGLVAGEWWLAIATNATFGTPRFTKYRYSTNVWSRANAAGTANDTSTPGASGTVKFGLGAAAIPYAGEIAVGALWSNRALTDAETEYLPFSLMHWYSLSPSALWVFDQSLTTQALVDYCGNANQTAITGTTVATAHPVVFNRHGEVIRAGAAAAAGQPTMRRWSGVPGMTSGPRQPGRSW